MATRSRSRANSPEDLGWPQESRPGGPPTATRSAEVRTTTDAASSGKSTYTAPTIPDPNISHGRLKILQRVDGVFIVHDTGAAPGQGTIVAIDPKSFRNTPEAAALAGKERDAEAKRQALKAADAEAKRLAADYPED